jgi:hypothetical protein
VSTEPDAATERACVCVRARLCVCACVRVCALRARCSTSNPAHEALVNYEGGPDKSRFSWDPLTTLAVIRGAEAVGTVECSTCDGRNVIDPATGT